MSWIVYKFKAQGNNKDQKVKEINVCILDKREKESECGVRKWETGTNRIIDEGNAADANSSDVGWESQSHPSNFGRVQLCEEK